MRITIKEMVLTALFVALIVIGTFIKIPVPYVPFTLQLMFTMFAGLLLGPRLGALAVIIYLVLGLLGVPVFAEGGGISYIFKPTFGYLIGFVFGTYATGYIANRDARPSVKRLLCANLLGLVIVYTFGLIYLYLVRSLYLINPIGIWQLFFYGMILPIPGDLIICVGGAFIGQRLIPMVKNSYSHSV